MGTKVDDANPPADPPADPPAAADPPAPDSGGGGGDGASGILAAIDERFTQLREELLGDPDPDPDNDPPAPVSSAGESVEERARRAVREEQDRIAGTRKTEDRLAAVEKVTIEKPPIKQGRVSRLLWGDVNK